MESAMKELVGGGAYKEWMVSRQEDRSFYIGPSGVDRCFRQHAYRYMGVEPTDVVPLGAANLGTLLHLGWSAMIGAQFDPKERAADVEVDWGGPRPGSADDVDYVHRIVSDVKSVSARNLRWWFDHGVSESYWTQLTCYAHGLAALHGGDWEMRIIAIPVDDGDGVERGEVYEFTRPYDPVVGEALVGKANERHQRLMDSRSLLGVLTENPLALVEEFPREGKGPGRFPCDWCPFVSACWPEAGEGRSPQSESVVDDPEAVGRWAVEYLEASAEESAAKRRKSDAAAFLKGVAGTFPAPDGSAVRVSVVGGRPREVVDMDGVRALLGDGVPMKVQASSSYSRVSRVR